MALVHTIELHRQCNHACSFCGARDGNSPSKSPGTVATEARAAAQRGVRVLRLTGGEPLLDRRLARAIAAAVEASAGALHVELETNASLPGAAQWAPELARAGLSRAWIHLHSGDPAVHDRESGQPGAFARAWQGAAALAGAGVDVGLNVPVRPVLEAAAEPLLALAAERLGPRFCGVRLWVVAAAWGSLPSPALDATLREFATGCRRLRVHCELEASRSPALCQLLPSTVERHPQLGAQALFASANTRVPTPHCPACPAQSVCSGALAAPLGPPAAPATESAWRAASAAQVGVRRGERAQISELQLTESPDAPHDAPPREKANVRVEWACNQRCQFCWVDFGWTPPSREQVLEDLALLRARGHDRLSITGGEPTLVPWLEDVVSTAASLGFSTVELQTNAVLLARAGRAEALARAGLTDALVSLHASSAEISDAITQKPGTFEQTVVGADALARAGVRLHISHVLTSANLCETERFVDFVVQRWGKATQVVWAVAHPITRASSRTSGAIPSFDAVRPALLQGLERSLTTGLAFGNINEACGVPPCVLGHDPRFVAPVSPELAKHEAFTHLPICATCEAKPRCRGVRKGYAELHGEAGLVPLHHGTARPHMGG